MRVVLRLLLGVALMAVVCLNLAVYLEYFSDGSPYVGRTENMDKWIDPRPWLSVIDLAALGALAWFIRAGERAKARLVGADSSASSSADRKARR